MAKVYLNDKSDSKYILISGILDEQSKNIFYSENGDLKTADVHSLFREFAGQKIEFILFVESEKEYFITLDDYKNSTVLGSLDESEIIIRGVLDESAGIIRGKL